MKRYIPLSIESNPFWEKIKAFSVEVSSDSEKYEDTFILGQKLGGTFSEVGAALIHLGMNVVEFFELE